MLGWLGNTRWRQLPGEVGEEGQETGQMEQGLGPKRKRLALPPGSTADPREARGTSSMASQVGAGTWTSLAFLLLLPPTRRTDPTPTPCPRVAARPSPSPKGPSDRVPPPPHTHTGSRREQLWGGASTCCLQVGDIRSRLCAQPGAGPGDRGCSDSCGGDEAARGAARPFRVNEAS